MKPLLLLMLVAWLPAADLPTITFTRLFPKSVPEYFSITLDKSGRADYREAVDDDNPLVFKLTPAETGEVFSLAQKLNWFNREIESGLNVARTGEKTFRFEDGAVRNQVKFNYSLDPDAQKLLSWFERIAETERHFIELERCARYDKLGVNQALLLLQAAFERNTVVAADQFLPLLDRISKNETYLHMARQRAAGLADAIRNPKPASVTP